MTLTRRTRSFSRPFDNSSNDSSLDRLSSLAPATSLAAAAAAATTVVMPPLPLASDRGRGHMAKILIGVKKRRFRVDRKLLCAASPFFADQLEGGSLQSRSRPVVLWLPGESASTFALFVEWLHHRPGFRWFLDDGVTSALEAGQLPTQNIHWAVIRLHLFAAHLDLFELQDIAMDALQDLYLRCDWDVYPSLVTYLYTKCDALAAVRLRRWAVAMVAFSLSVAASPRTSYPRPHRASNTHKRSHSHGHHQSPSDPAPLRALLDQLPEFADDLAMHHRKMRASGLDARFKNPQLRLPTNSLRNDERAFGYRECSFHSHRASIGERRCPYGVGRAHSTQVAVVELEATPGVTRLSAPKKRDQAGSSPLLMSSVDDAGRPMNHMRSVSSTLQ